MPIKFAVQIVRLKVFMTIDSAMILTFIQGHKLMRLKCDYFFNWQYISDNISAITFKLDMAVDLWIPYNDMLMFVLVTFTLLQGHSGSATAKKICVARSRQLRKQ